MPYLLDLPSAIPVVVDPTKIVCMRVVDEGGVVVHTSEGFAFPLAPRVNDDGTVESPGDLLVAALEALEAFQVERGWTVARPTPD